MEIENLPDDVLSQLHDPEKSNQTEVAYRLAWARTYLKKYGLLENSTRGVWALTAKAKETEQVDPQDVVRTVRSLDKKEFPETDTETSVPPEVSQEEEWKQKLHAILTQKLAPAAFERLVQRLLRESGFTQVEVTGRIGDGGIDGAWNSTHPRIHELSRPVPVQAIQGIRSIERDSGLSWCHGGTGRQGLVYHNGNLQPCRCEGGDT